MTIDDLIRYVAASSAKLRRTTDLEQKIRIGTGFHGKWYRSQREHWLGWLIYQQCEASRKGVDFTNHFAQPTWNRLKCSPAMFWMAEAACVESSVLDEAEAAAIEATKLNPKDGNPHGRMMRTSLPWHLVEDAFLVNVTSLPEKDARCSADEAFDRLMALRPEFRKCAPFRPT